MRLVHPIFVGSNLEALNESFLLRTALKFGVIVQKYALKLIKKNWKFIEILKRCKFFRSFLIFGRNKGERKLTGWDIILVHAADPAELRKVYKKFVQITREKLINLTGIYAGFLGWGGSAKCLGGSDFSLGERNFTIGQSPKIWGNFSKICRLIVKIREKCKFLGNFLNFLAGNNLFIMGKIRN